MSTLAQRAATAWRFVLAPALVYLAGFAVLTWPAVTHFGTHFLCDTGDGLANAWNLWWVGEAVAELRNPWFTDRLFHPDGVTLIAQTLNPFNGFLLAPLQDVVPLHVRYNLALLFGFVATGLTTAWLTHHVMRGRSWPAAVAGGFAFTFSGYHFARAYGHLDLVSIEWVPLFLLAWLRLLENARARDAVLAAVALLLVKWCNDYYTLYCVLAGALLLAHRAVTAPQTIADRRLLRALVVFTALALILVGPFVLALWWSNRADPFVGSHDAARYGLDLFAPLIPTAHWRFAGWTEGYWGALPHNPIESSSYLRYTLLVPALLALCVPRRFAPEVRRGPLVLVAIAFWLLALGPVLHVVGTPVHGVPMPYSALEVVFPPLELSGVPLRMFAMTTLVVTILASAALPALWSRMPTFGRVAFVAVFVFETWPYELPRTRLEEPRWVAALAELPDGAVAGLEGDPIDMLRQTRFEKPMISGYLARRPASLADRTADIESAGSGRELMERFDARYLLVDKFDPRRGALEQDFRWVFRGPEKDVLVLRDDELPSAAPDPRDCASGAPVEVAIERDEDGVPRALTIHAPADAGRPYQVGFAFAAEPPILLHDGREIPLAADALFERALAADNALVSDHEGVLDEQGRARVTLRFDAAPELGGRTIHYCAVVRDPAAPLGYCRIGPSGRLEVPGR